jgi:hypothetical protein
MVLSVKMKGQTNIISVIIIILIATAAMATVLPWAYSMIQKKQDMKTMDDVYNFFQTMDSTIRNIAQNGGEESLQLKVPGKLEVYPDSVSNNSIIFTTESKVSFIAEGDWIPLNTPNMNETATLGPDSASVIFGKAQRSGDKIIVQYKLWYRALNNTSGHLYKIVLNTSNNNAISTTTGFMRVQSLGSQDVTGKPLTITKINIIL